MNPVSKIILTGKDGIVLIVCLMVMVVSSLLAASLYLLCRTDIEITTNQNNATTAFFHADAGVRYAIRTIESALESNSRLKLEDLADSLRVTPPSGMLFKEIQGMTAVDTNHMVYSLAVLSQSGNQANAEIEITLKRKPVFDLGIFGNVAVAVQPGDTILSYDSRQYPPDYRPSPDNTTGEADIGSNGEVSFQPNTINDGLVVLGENIVGQLADCDNCETRDVIELDGPIDPDPLGFNAGDMASMFQYVASNNDNDRQSAISGTDKLQTTPQEHLTLTSGTYYLNEFNLKGTMTVDTSAGPVFIYLSGDMKLWPGSEVNFSGRPTDFIVFSNADDPITILPNSDYKGIVVAPFADVRMLPNQDFFGTVWGRNVRLQPGGHVYVDTALQERYLSNKLEMVSWKEQRNI